MPAPKHPVWQHFRTDFANSHYLSDKDHKAAFCTACLTKKVNTIMTHEEWDNTYDATRVMRSREAVEQEVFATHSAGFPVSGKPELMIKHLRSCEAVLPEVKNWALLQRTSREREKENPYPSTPTRAHRPAIPSYPPLADSPSKRLRLNSSSDIIAGSDVAVTIPGPFNQAAFESDLCDVFVYNGWSFNSADAPIWRRFLTRWVPDSGPVSGQRLSGPILDQRFLAMEKRIEPLIEQKMGTGQCDGWKDISKTSLVSSSVTVDTEPYLIATHNVTSKPKSARTLLSLVMKDITYCHDVLRINIIAWCSDAGGDAASMRRQLVQACPWIIVVDCWAHQMNLVVGDYFKLKLVWEQYIEMALELIKWINNHSLALSQLEAQQRMQRVLILVLILPVLTRWTSHFVAIQRLSDLRPFIEAMVTTSYEFLVLAAGQRKDAQAKAEVVLAYVKDPLFWAGLERVQLHLKPLAIATNIMQANSTRLDDVLLTLAFLYKTYSSPVIEEDVSEGILKSLETRWSKNADHDAFIMAVFLNPYVRNRAFRKGNPALTPISLYDMAKRLYTRLFRRDPGTGFHGAFWSYIRVEKEFSDAKMKLVDWEMAHRAEVEAGSTNASLDIAQIWEALDDGQDDGRNTLTKMAVRLFKVTPNSGGSERVFSQMGNIHTKLRNRIKAEKVHKIVAIKMDLKRVERDAEETHRVRHKRKLEASTHSLPTSLTTTRIPNPTPSFRTGPASAITHMQPAPPTTLSTRPSTCPSNPATTSTSTGASSGTTAEAEDTESEQEGVAGEREESIGSSAAARMQPSEFSAVAESLIQQSEEDALLNPAPAPNPAPARDNSSDTSVDDDTAAEINETNALTLKNMFNFSAAGLAFAWQRGSRSLRADTDLHEYLSMRDVQ